MGDDFYRTRVTVEMRGTAKCFRHSDEKLTQTSISAFYAKVTKTIDPIVTYVIKLPIPMYSKKNFVSYCVDG